MRLARARGCAAPQAWRAFAAAWNGGSAAPGDAGGAAMGAASRLSRRSSDHEVGADLQRTRRAAWPALREDNHELSHGRPDCWFRCAAGSVRAMAVGQERPIAADAAPAREVAAISGRGAPGAAAGPVHQRQRPRPQASRTHWSCLAPVPLLHRSEVPSGTSDDEARPGAKVRVAARPQRSGTKRMASPPPGASVSSSRSVLPTSRVSRTNANGLLR